MSAPWAPMVAPPLPAADLLRDTCEHGFAAQTCDIDPEHIIQRAFHALDQARPVGEWPAEREEA